MYDPGRIPILVLVALIVLFYLNKYLGNKVVNKHLAEALANEGLRIKDHRPLTILETFRHSQKMHLPIISSYALLFVEPRIRSRHYRFIEYEDDYGHEKTSYIEVKVSWSGALEFDSIN